jgi:hypothetical protein
LVIRAMMQSLMRVQERHDAVGYAAQRSTQGEEEINCTGWTKFASSAVPSNHQMEPVVFSHVLIPLCCGVVRREGLVGESGLE